MQRLKQFLVLGESAARLVHIRGEGAFFLLFLFQVNLGDFNPAHLRLVVGQLFHVFFLFLKPAAMAAFARWVLDFQVGRHLLLPAE